MITTDWKWTMISLAQQIHKNHIIGNQDHQKIILKKKKKKKKDHQKKKKKKRKEREREREKNNILCVRKLCIECERELEFIIRR